MRVAVFAAATIDLLGPAALAPVSAVSARALPCRRRWCCFSRFCYYWNVFCATVLAALFAIAAGLLAFSIGIAAVLVYTSAIVHSSTFSVVTATLISAATVAGNSSSASTALAAAAVARSELDIGGTTACIATPPLASCTYSCYACNYNFSILCAGFLDACMIVVAILVAAAAADVSLIFVPAVVAECTIALSQAALPTCSTRFCLHFCLIASWRCRCGCSRATSELAAYTRTFCEFVSKSVYQVT